MIATLVDLQVGSAGQGDLHFDQHFPVAYPGNRYFFNLHVLFAIEDRCCHLTVHARLPSPEPPGCITIFIESGWGWAARLRASTLRDNENRWLINRFRSISRFITNRTESSCNSTEALYDPNNVFSSTQTAPGSKVASPCTVCANSKTRPPGRTASIAVRIRPLPPTARMAASAPLPSVSSRTAFTTSVRDASMLFPKP